MLSKKRFYVSLIVFDKRVSKYVIFFYGRKPYNLISNISIA